MSDDFDPFGPDWEPPKQRGTTAAPAPLARPAGPARPARRTATRTRPSRPHPLVIAISLLPIALVFVTMQGIGLRRELAPWEATLGAALLSILPALGISGIFRHHRAALVAGLWLWPVTLLIGLPRWLPGERGPGLAEGMAWAAMPFGETAASTAGRAGARLAELLGSDRELPMEITPIATVELRPEGETPDERPPRSEPGRIVLPYEGGGHSLRVLVTFDGPDFSEELPVLFDTGATFTTLDRGALQKLGVEIPADAPTARFQTANGQVESPMVLLDRIWLGDRAIDGVTVAVCDDCSQESTVGLLGLNVTNQFRVEVDHEAQEIVLEATPGVGDRHLDITHWLSIEGRATRWPTGRVVVELTARNTSIRDVDEAVVEVECPDRSFAVTLTSVPAGGQQSTRFELPRGTDCAEYRLVPRSGRW